MFVFKQLAFYKLFYVCVYIFKNEIDLSFVQSMYCLDLTATKCVWTTYSIVVYKSFIVSINI